ncbi:hypothetical protein ACGFNU_17355 [Spirillospora sp. NPDC048911]|uniref:hypothetical protein n=1 Tax=Spirillospora sp. NPDC048911 TaxID=3364527 RepID=UPI00372089ED
MSTDDDATAAPLLEDRHLARLLMTTWALISGRAVPDAPPSRLTERQLIDFWADDLLDADAAPMRRGSHP